MDFFEKIGMSRFEHDVFSIKETTKIIFLDKIDIESIHIRSNLDNFKMSEIFEKLTSSSMMDNITLLIEKKSWIVWWNSKKS